MEWFLFIVAAIVAWIWWDGLGAKEVAFAECKKLCQQHDVLFLDDSVAMRKLSFCRHKSGRIGLFRRFGFEFTSDGTERYEGYVDVFVRDVLQTHMDAYRL